jgi:hypothetical protein
MFKKFLSSSASSRKFQVAKGDTDDDNMTSSLVAPSRPSTSTTSRPSLPDRGDEQPLLTPQHGDDEDFMDQEPLLILPEGTEEEEEEQQQHENQLLLLTDLERLDSPAAASLRRQSAYHDQDDDDDDNFSLHTISSQESIDISEFQQPLETNDPAPDTTTTTTTTTGVGTVLAVMNTTITRGFNNNDAPWPPCSPTAPSQLSFGVSQVDDDDVSNLPSIPSNSKDSGSSGGSNPIDKSSQGSTMANNENAPAAKSWKWRCATLAAVVVVVVAAMTVLRGAGRVALPFNQATAKAATARNTTIWFLDVDVVDAAETAILSDAVVDTAVVDMVAPHDSAKPDEQPKKEEDVSLHRDLVVAETTTTGDSNQQQQQQESNPVQETPHVPMDSTDDDNSNDDVVQGEEYVVTIPETVWDRDEDMVGHFQDTPTTQEHTATSSETAPENEDECLDNHKKIDDTTPSERQENIVDEKEEEISVSSLAALPFFGLLIMIYKSSSRNSNQEGSSTRKTKKKKVKSEYNADVSFFTGIPPKIEPSKYMVDYYSHNDENGEYGDDDGDDNDDDAGVDLSSYEFLSAAQLRSLLQQRRCNTQGTKDTMIKRLVMVYQAELSTLTVQQLRPKLRGHGLGQGGCKKDLVRRLIECGPP